MQCCNESSLVPCFIYFNTICELFVIFSGNIFMHFKRKSDREDNTADRHQESQMVCKNVLTRLSSRIVAVLVRKYPWLFQALFRQDRDRAWTPPIR